MSAANLASYVYNKLSGSGPLNTSSREGTPVYSSSISPNPRLTTVWRSKPSDSGSMDSPSPFKEDGTLLKLLRSRSKSMTSINHEKSPTSKFKPVVAIPSSTPTRGDSPLNQSTVSSQASPLTSRRINPKRELEMSNFIDSPTSTSIISPPPTPVEESSKSGPKLTRSVSDGNIIKRRRNQLRNNWDDFPPEGMPSIKFLRSRFEVTEDSEQKLKEKSQIIKKTAENRDEKVESRTHPKILARHESLRRWERQESENTPKTQEITMTLTSVRKILQQFESASNQSSDHESSDTSSQRRSRPSKRTTVRQISLERQISQDNIEAVATETTDGAYKKQIAFRTRSKSEPNWRDHKHDSMMHTSVSVMQLRRQFESQVAPVKTYLPEKKLMREEKNVLAQSPSFNVKEMDNIDAFRKREIQLIENHNTNMQVQHAISSVDKIIESSANKTQKNVIKTDLENHIPLEEQVKPSSEVKRNVDLDQISSLSSVRVLRKQYEEITLSQSSPKTDERDNFRREQETDQEKNVNNYAEENCVTTSVKNLQHHFESLSPGRVFEDDVNRKHEFNFRNNANIDINTKATAHNKSIGKIVDVFENKSIYKDLDSEEEFYDDSSSSSSSSSDEESDHSHPSMKKGISMEQKMISSKSENNAQIRVLSERTILPVTKKRITDLENDHYSISVETPQHSRKSLSPVRNVEDKVNIAFEWKDSSNTDTVIKHKSPSQEKSNRKIIEVLQNESIQKDQDSDEEFYDESSNSDEESAPAHFSPMAIEKDTEVIKSDLRDNYNSSIERPQHHVELLLPNQAYENNKDKVQTESECKTSGNTSTIISKEIKLEHRSLPNEEDSEEEFYDESSSSSSEDDGNKGKDKNRICMKMPLMKKHIGRKSVSDGTSSEDDEELDRQREDEERIQKEAELENKHWHRVEQEEMERKMEEQLLEKEKSIQVRLETGRVDQERRAWEKEEQERISLEMAELEEIALERVEQEFRSSEDEGIKRVNETSKNNIGLLKAEETIIESVKREEPHKEFEEAEEKKSFEKVKEQEQEGVLEIKTEYQNRQGLMGVKQEKEVLEKIDLKGGEEMKEKEEGKEKKVGLDLEQERRDKEWTEQRRLDREMETAELQNGHMVGKLVDRFTGILDNGDNSNIEKNSTGTCSTQNVMVESSGKVSELISTFLNAKEQDNEICPTDIRIAETSYEGQRMVGAAHSKSILDKNRMGSSSSSSSSSDNESTDTLPATYPEEQQIDRKVETLISTFNNTERTESEFKVKEDSIDSEVTRTGIGKSDFNVSQLVEKLSRKNSWGSNSSDGESTNSLDAKHTKHSPIPKVSTKNIPGKVRELNLDELCFFNKDGAAAQAFYRTSSLREKKDIPFLRTRSGSLKPKESEPHPLSSRARSSAAKDIPQTCRNLRPDEMRFFFTSNNNIYSTKKDNEQTSESKQDFRLDSQGNLQKQDQLNMFPGVDRPSILKYDSDSDCSLLRGCDQGDESSDEALIFLGEEDFSLNVSSHFQDTDSEDDEANWSYVTGMDFTTEENMTDESNMEFNVGTLLIRKLNPDLQVFANNENLCLWDHNENSKNESNDEEQFNMSNTEHPNGYSITQPHIQVTATFPAMPETRDTKDIESSDSESSDNDHSCIKQESLDCDEESKQILEKSYLVLEAKDQVNQNKEESFIQLQIDEELVQRKLNSSSEVKTSFTIVPSHDRDDFNVIGGSSENITNKIIEVTGVTSNSDHESSNSKMGDNDCGLIEQAMIPMQNNEILYLNLETDDQFERGEQETVIQLKRNEKLHQSTKNSTPEPETKSGTVKTLDKTICDLGSSHQLNLKNQSTENNRERSDSDSSDSDHDQMEQALPETDNKPKQDQKIIYSQQETNEKLERGQILSFSEIERDVKFEQSQKNSLSNLIMDKELTQSKTHSSPELDSEKYECSDSMSLIKLKADEELDQSLEKSVSEVGTDEAFSQLESQMDHVKPEPLESVEHQESRLTATSTDDITDEEVLASVNNSQHDRTKLKPIEDYYMYFDESKEYLSSRDFAVFCFLVAGLSILIYFVYVLVVL